VVLISLPNNSSVISTATANMTFSPEGSIGIALALLFGAASGATMIWPTHREIGYGIIALSLFGLVMLGLHQFFGITTGRIVPFVGMVFCGFGFLAFGSWYFWPRIPEVNARTQEVSAGTAVGITKDFSINGDRATAKFGPDAGNLVGNVIRTTQVGAPKNGIIPIDINLNKKGATPIKIKFVQLVRVFFNGRDKSNETTDAELVMRTAIRDSAISNPFDDPTQEYTMQIGGTNVFYVKSRAASVTLDGIERAGIISIDKNGPHVLRAVFESPELT